MANPEVSKPKRKQMVCNSDVREGNYDVSYIGNFGNKKEAVITDKNALISKKKPRKIKRNKSFKDLVNYFCAEELTEEINT